MEKITENNYYSIKSKIEEDLNVVFQIEKEVGELEIFSYSEDTLIKKMIQDKLTQSEVFRQVPESFQLYKINQDKDFYFKIVDPRKEHKMLFCNKLSKELEKFDLDIDSKWIYFLESNGYKIHENELSEIDLTQLDVNVEIEETRELQSDERENIIPIDELELIFKKDNDIVDKGQQIEKFSVRKSKIKDDYEQQIEMEIV